MSLTAAGCLTFATGFVATNLISYPELFPLKEFRVPHKHYKNLIGGQWVASHTGKTFLNINPANSEDIVGEFQSSGAQEIGRAHV